MSKTTITNYHLKIKEQLNDMQERVGKIGVVPLSWLEELKHGIKSVNDIAATFPNEKRDAVGTIMLKAYQEGIVEREKVGRLYYYWLSDKTYELLTGDKKK